MIGMGYSCLVEILPKPLMACPILSLRLRSAENDFLRCMDIRPVRGSATSSSAGGVGSEGKAVIFMFVEPTVEVETVRAVCGRCLKPRLLELADAAGFLITGKASTPETLEVDGRLIWLAGRENGCGYVAEVGVLIRLLMLLMRAWLMLKAVESRGTLDFRSARDFGR